MIGLLGMVVGQLIVYFGVQNHLSVPWVMAGWTFGFLASGMAMAMPFSVSVRQRGLWRMENRRSRRGLSDGDWRGVLPEGGQRTWRCIARVDFGMPPVTCQCRTNAAITARHRIWLHLAAGDFLCSRSRCRFCFTKNTNCSSRKSTLNSKRAGQNAEAFQMRFDNL